MKMIRAISGQAGVQSAEAGAGSEAKIALDLHKRLAEAKLPQEKTTLQRQIEATDGQIDRLVYELYGLTEEEIGIVESGSGKS